MRLSPIPIRHRKAHRPMSSALNRRHQLTLFAPEPQRSEIDMLRRALDPVQARLISAHVTLCREDEFDAEEVIELLDRAARWTGGPIQLEFGESRRFNGHGILIPCIHGSETFHRLRQWVLRDEHVRVHEPHLTLAHPRNPRSLGNDEKALSLCPSNFNVSFTTLAAIEQVQSEQWQVHKLISLGGKPKDSDA